MDVINEIYSDILFGLTGARSSCIYGPKLALKELIPSTEFVLLNRIAAIGEKYCEIFKFIEEKRVEKLRNNGMGQYLLSCVYNLDQCLKPYRREIYLLHHNNKKSRLANIYVRIYPYDELLQGLLLMVRELSICQIRGTAVLEILDKYVNTSVGGVRVAVKHIRKGVSQVLFSQLLSWLLYGDITDTAKEFFIQISSPDSKSPFEKFSISQALLPAFIRPEVADQILTVGQTVYFLRSRPEKPSKPDYVFIDSSGIILEEANKITAEMKEVENTRSCHKLKLLENVVGSVKTLVTMELHTLAIKEANLVQQLHMIKDLFLMGRGELFHEFVTQIDKVSLKNSITDLNLILQSCARKLLISEETLEPFYLEMVPSETGQLLSIHYNVPWPLELLFTPNVIESYNHIFRFLLRLKRVQVKMVAAWLRDKTKRKLTSCAKRRQLQNNLWFLVNNLQYYLQVDVLDSQFMALETAVIDSKNFDEIRLAHTSFLANLTVQSFLDSPRDSGGIVSPVQQRLNAIIKLCEEFCMQAERSEDEEMSNDVVHCLSVKFDACFNRLFTLLAALKKHSGNPCCQHLGQLLLRLDFNMFFSSNSSLDNLDAF